MCVCGTKILAERQRLRACVLYNARVVIMPFVTRGAFLLQSVTTALVENGSQRCFLVGRLRSSFSKILPLEHMYISLSLSPHCINTRTRRKRPRDLRTRPHRARCTTAGAISRLSRSLRPSRCRRRVAESLRFSFFFSVYLCERRV